MKEKQKMKQSIFQSIEGKQMRSSEMKGKQPNLGTESSLTASDESGNSGGIYVYSIKFTKSSYCRNLVYKIQVQNS